MANDDCSVYISDASAPATRSGCRYIHKNCTEVIITAYLESMLRSPVEC